MSQLFNFNGRWMTRDQFVKERYGENPESVEVPNVSDENPESEVLEEAVEKNKEVSKTSKPSKKNKSKK